MKSHTKDSVQLLLPTERNELTLSSLAQVHTFKSIKCFFNRTIARP